MLPVGHSDNAAIKRCPAQYRKKKIATVANGKITRGFDSNFKQAKGSDSRGQRRERFLIRFYICTYFIISIAY